MFEMFEMFEMLEMSESAALLNAQNKGYR